MTAKQQRNKQPGNQQDASPANANPKALAPAGPGKAAQLLSLLSSHPELADKLAEALETKRFFVTVSCQKKVPGRPGDLQHYWIRRGYEINDVLPSLRVIEGDWVRKENPTAELPEGQGWH
jgi:hypothetical protein